MTKTTIRERDVLAGMIEGPTPAETFARMCNDSRLVRSLIRKELVRLNSIPATLVHITDRGRAAIGTLSSGERRD